MRVSGKRGNNMRKVRQGIPISQACTRSPSLPLHTDLVPWPKCRRILWFCGWREKEGRNAPPVASLRTRLLLHTAAGEVFFAPACLLACLVREFAFWSLARCVYACKLLHDIAEWWVGAGGLQGPGSPLYAFLNCSSCCFWRLPLG